MIPIFLLTCDRISVLQQMLKSLEQNVATPHEVVIHDNGSTYQPMKDFLRDLEQKGVRVYRDAPLSHQAAGLDRVWNSISDWYKTNDSPYYVVSDPDIEIQPSDGRILEFYKHLLELHPDAQVAGPMLRIDDIPHHYPLRAEVLRRHTEQFGAKPQRLCRGTANSSSSNAPPLIQPLACIVRASSIAACAWD